MKGLSVFSKLIAVFIVVMVSASLCLAEGELIGKWVANSGNQRLMLEFKPGNVLTYNGEDFSYVTMNNMIIVGDIFDASVYPYQLSGDVLQVDMSADGGGLTTYNRTSDEQFGQMQQQQQAQAGQMAQQLAGKWVRSKGGRQLLLKPDGTYEDYSESASSGQYTDAWSGESTGSWGTYGSSEAAGRWSATGTAEQGTITLTSNDGSQNQIQYRVHSESGSVYWNEYWFNGDHYSRQ